MCLKVCNIFLNRSEWMNEKKKEDRKKERKKETNNTINNERKGRE
jgi:hypothetical protein